MRCTAASPAASSRSLTTKQARAVLHAAEGERLWPSSAVSKLGGIRTEEARPCAGPRWALVGYRLQLRPVLRTAAIALGSLFESRGATDGGQT
jgi:hypothetical protein